MSIKQHIIIVDLNYIIYRDIFSQELEERKENFKQNK